MKKFFVILSFVLLITIAIPSTAMAATIESKQIISVTNGSHNFKDDWSAVAKTTYAGVECRLSYGFNTFLTNEDTATSYTIGNGHRSRLKNDNGTHYGSWMYANEFFDIEVRHKGSRIYYYMDWRTK